MNEPTDLALISQEISFEGDRTSSWHFAFKEPPSLRFVEGSRLPESKSRAGFETDWLIDHKEPGSKFLVSMSTFIGEDHRYVLPAVWQAKTDSTAENFLALQRWEGIVLECRGDTFFARLDDLTSDGPAEEIELAIEDVAPEDRVLIEPGAVFYWSIGYRDDASGRRWRASTLRFRRLPVWSQAELEAAQERANEVAGVFGGD